MDPILNKYKKKSLEGMQDFVRNLEVMSHDRKQVVIQNALLEDPVYMTWVMKNIVTFEYFYQLTPEDVEQVLAEIPNGTVYLIKAIKNTQHENPFKEKLLSEKTLKSFLDEYEYQKVESPGQQLACQTKMLEILRKLQKNKRVVDWDWKVPSLEILEGKHLQPPSKGAFKLCYENSTVALTGSFESKLREGKWMHYYPNGKLMAEGIYIKNSKEGPWTFYYVTGEKKSSGDFKEDLKQGIWKNYLKNGQEEEQVFERGKVAKG